MYLLYSFNYAGKYSKDYLDLTGTLSYADDITLIALSIGGLNEMLKLCDNYANVYNVMFNSKKTVFIKFGDEVIRNEAAF